MKKPSKAKRNGSMRTEYDFALGTRGKHAASYAKGANVIVLDPDVATEFPTAGDVNEALRGLMKIMRRRRNKPSKSA